MPKPVKYLLVVLGIFAVYAIFSSPNEAADLVAGIVNAVLAAIGAVFDFFDALLNAFST